MTSPEQFDDQVAALRDYDAEAALYAEVLGEERADRCILELGAGTGLLAVRLADRVAGVHALDRDPGMLRRLQDERPRSNVFPLLGDATRLPVATGSLAAVCAPFGFVTNFRTPAALAGLLDGVSRVLEPGGLALLNGFDTAVVLARYGLRVRQRYNPYGRLGSVPAWVTVDVVGQDTELTFEIGDRPSLEVAFSLRGWDPGTLISAASGHGLEADSLRDAGTGGPYDPGSSEEYLLALRRTGP